MKALVLSLVAAVGLGAATSTQAGVWFDSPFVFDVPHDVGPHHGGPYFVAGFGDDNALDQPRYWGGPYWTLCRGLNPPFQTYRIPPASCRQWFVKVAGRHHQHISKARLK